MLLRSNFSSFPHYFIYIFLASGVKLHIHLLNVVVQFIVFLTLSILICRSTDISKCFSESLGIRDNGSRLYITIINQSIAEINRSIETDMHKQIMLTQVRCHRMWHLIRVYTVCHSVQQFLASTGSEMDLIKHNWLKCQNI